MFKMFDGEDEYTRAIQNARLNTYSVRNKINIKFFLLNLFIFMIFILIGYLGLDYLKRYDGDLKKRSVMGVTHINPNYTMNDSELMEVINELEEKVVTLKQEVRMKKVVDDLVEASEATHVKSRVPQYNNQSLRAIFVQHGDTLASLSEEFYGNSMAFHKIIKANSSLSNESHTIYVGQKIYIPY